MKLMSPGLAALMAALMTALIAACAPEAPAAPAELPAADAAAIEAHMAYLASDDLEGREAGTPGFDLAAAYVAGEFAKIGIAPAGDSATYFQEITFQRSVRAAEGRKFEVKDAAGNLLPLTEGIDAVVYNSLRAPEASVDAPAVFVGFGIDAPELGRDDFAGLDLTGKVAVMLSGTPKGIDNEERAFYGNRKLKNISDRGAVATVSIETPTSKGVYPFQRLLAEGRLEGASLAWLQADAAAYTNAPNIQATSAVSLEGAPALFAGAPSTWEAIIAVAEAEGGAVTGFDMPLTISITQRSTHDTVRSANVVGMLEGTDPELKDEVIVISAHLDHIGISRSIGEDTINNGALDNASGIATMLDAARMLKNGPPLRRTVVFAAVTAEEKGLLGAQYFVMNPSVPCTIVANVNLDMPILTYDFTDVIVYGALRSNIAATVETAAAAMGVTISPDPTPEQGIFTRSDHFRFVEAGIPAVYLKPGFQNGGDIAWADHQARNYHRPSDDMSNNLDFNAAARFAELNARIALALASQDARPLWKKDDFFARQFGGPMEP